MTQPTPEYLAGVADEASGLPLNHDICEQRVGTYKTPEQIKAYFDGRRDRAMAQLQ